MFANILQFALPRACIVHFRVLIKSVRVRVLRYFSAFRFRKGIKIKTESFAIQDRHALKERKQMSKYPIKTTHNTFYTLVDTLTKLLTHPHYYAPMFDHIKKKLHKPQAVIKK